MAASIKRIKYIVSNMDKPEFIMLDIPADLKYLETISNVLDIVLERIDEQPKDPQSHFAVKLSAHEACANIVEHAYHGKPGRIKVEILLFPVSKKIVINLSDQGDEAVLNYDRPNFEQPQIRGYGLYLIQQLVDKVEYFREGGTNRWSLAKAL